MKLKAVSAAGETLSQVLPVKVVDPVSIDKFTASRTHIGLGESVQLNWVLGPSPAAVASERINDGTTDLAGVTGLTGMITVSPSATTTYTFFAKNAAGDGTQKSVTITVGKPTATEGEVSEGYGRGTHTTTSSTLYDLGGGTRIIDTPGVRSFGLWTVNDEDLRQAFPEFAHRGCRFRDCAHGEEPGCAVREGVESGELSRFRYETYRRLREG